MVMSDPSKMEKKLPRTKVKVVVRVRPVLKANSDICVAALPSKKSLQIINYRNPKEHLQYDFSSVHDHTASQHDIFSDTVQPYLQHCFEGKNVSILAYGPTGAGKTHTMLGLASDPGIIPRVIKNLFQIIEGERNNMISPKSKSEIPQTTVTFSYLEIYNEKVRDLLVTESSDLPIREDAKHNIFVAGLKEETIDSFETFKQHFGPACGNRTVAATRLNEHSSRSHSILLLKVQRKIKGKQYTGKIYMIDLAGSEDNRRTGNKGIRLKESGAINKSLFVLGEVVDAINNNVARIPYRNSKLTRLLQDSIGGNCFSVMVINVAPEKHYYYDTYCTLNFATKSKKIVNVNTTNCIEENPLSQVSKPLVALKPNKSQEVKKEVSTGKSELTQEILPSPLVRRQNEWELAANQRLEEVEKQLLRLKQLEKMRTSFDLSEQSSSCIHDKTFIISTNLCSSQHSEVDSSDGSPSAIPPTPDCRKRPKGLKDMSNFLLMDEKRQKPLLKRVLDSGPSCSPLFIDSPSETKRKKSSRKDDKGTPKRRKMKKQIMEELSSQKQDERNSAFLEALNSGDVKELQQLQTVGVKRAKLIFEWRELHGKFENIESLREIPGFTQKFLENLLRSNFVSK